MKTCFKCGATKALTEFYRHPKTADGHLGKCKSCAKRDVQQWYRRSRSVRQAYERERGARPERREHANNAARLTRLRHPERVAARRAVGNAVRDGRLMRLPCEFCGDPKAQAHHEDYSKPLDVRWLCVTHHHATHGHSVVVQV